MLRAMELVRPLANYVKHQCMALTTTAKCFLDVRRIIALPHLEMVDRDMPGLVVLEYVAPRVLPGVV